eukprot:scaffold10583_cov290-Chaetoceros_neogracile.AAC.12
MTFGPKRRMRNIFKRRRQRKNRSEAEENLLLSGSEFDKKKVRSTPSKRHLNSDGSSGPHLQALLQSISAPEAALSLSIPVRKNRRKIYKSKMTPNEIETKSDEHTTIGPTSTSIANRNHNKDSIVAVRDSRQSLNTNDSSGRQLQNILEKLVVDDEVSRTNGSTPKPPRVKQVSRNKEFNLISPSKLEDIQEKPSQNKQAANDPFGAHDPYSNDFCLGTPSRGARYEMDANEQSKIFLRQRKKLGKRSKRRETPITAFERSRDMFKNCGMMIPALAVSPGSTVSMSSCSLDSILDDPERLEKYKLLNQPPPPPPPKRIFEDSNLVDRKWTDGIKNTMTEAYGKASRLFGCTSPLMP